MNNVESILLYLFIFLTSTFFANLTTSFKCNAGDYYQSYNKGFFFLAFLIPWIFIGFTNIGVDYKSYYEIISIMSWSKLTANVSLEPGMNVVFILLKSISRGNVDLAIFILKTITISIFFFAIWRMRDRVNLGLSVFAYLLVIYLPSFYLLSICFAASIILLSVVIGFFENRKILSILLVILAAQFHNACYLYLPVIILCYIIDSELFKRLRKIWMLVSIMAVILIVIFASQIYQLASSNIASFHYSNYAGYQTSGSGLFIFVVYIPLFVFWYYLKKHDGRCMISNKLFIFLLFSFMFSMLSYRFRVIERMEIVLSAYYIILFPYAVSSSCGVKSRFNAITLIEFVFIVLLIFRGYMVFSDRVTSGTGLLHYSFFNPFL